MEHDKSPVEQKKVYRRNSGKAKRELYKRAGAKTEHGAARGVGFGVAIAACSCALVLLLIFVGASVYYNAVMQQASTGEAAGDERRFWGVFQTNADYKDERPVLVLDPGHGGDDPGAMDATGANTEAVINREMALRVAEKLALHEDVLRVVLTVEEGENKTVAERGKVAAAERADLLLAMHLNGDEDKKVRGFQCFPAPPGNRYYKDSMRFAEYLSEEVARCTDVGIKGANGIFYTYYHEEKDGSYSQNVLDSTWPGANDGSRDVTYGVLQNAKCPAVLVEQWYITNLDDMRLCNNPKGKEAMAQAIYRAICRYFELTPKS